MRHMAYAVEYMRCERKERWQKRGGPREGRESVGLENVTRLSLILIIIGIGGQNPSRGFKEKTEKNRSAAV